MTVGRDVHSLRSSVISVLGHFGPHKIWYIVKFRHLSPAFIFRKNNIVIGIICRHFIAQLIADCNKRSCRWILSLATQVAQLVARHCRPCVIALRCYKILMQLFMLLCSGRNTVVHPCTIFPMCLLCSVGEYTNSKMRFFFKIFYASHLTDVNEIWQDEGD